MSICTVHYAKTPLMH